MTKLSLLIQVNPLIKLSYWFKFNQRINSNIKQYLLLNRKEKTKFYCSHLKSAQSMNSGPHNPLVHSTPGLQGRVPPGPGKKSPARPDFTARKIGPRPLNHVDARRHAPWRLVGNTVTRRMIYRVLNSNNIESKTLSARTKKLKI
jgi:hypothetical protein